MRETSARGIAMSSFVPDRPGPHAAISHPTPDWRVASIPGGTPGDAMPGGGRLISVWRPTTAELSAAEAASHSRCATGQIYFLCPSPRLRHRHAARVPENPPEPLTTKDEGNRHVMAWQPCCIVKARMAAFCVSRANPDW